jgi:hypothetical protein
LWGILCSSPGICLEELGNSVSTAGLMAEILIYDLLTKQERYDLNAKFPKKITDGLAVDSALDFHCLGKYIQIKLGIL